jgi:hypothetical protein
MLRHMQYAVLITVGRYELSISINKFHVVILMNWFICVGIDT